MSEDMRGVIWEELKTLHLRARKRLCGPDSAIIAAQVNEHMALARAAVKVLHETALDDYTSVATERALDFLRAALPEGTPEEP